jgi:Na+-driven multidrug efflux pump
MMALVLYFLANPVARLFNNDPEVIHDLVIYLRLVPSGLGFFGVMMISNHILNVLGKPVKAAVVMLSRVFVFYIPLAFLGALYYQLPGVFLAAPLSSLMIAVIAYVILKKELKYLDVQ